jgi:XTP/dITP diphosphohydrolase
MPLTLYVATSSPGKLRDFAAMARIFGRETSFCILPGLNEIPPPPENALTFEETSRSKAVAYSAHSAGQIVLADDSGLEVDALSGAPGVRSARYAEDAGIATESTSSIDERNNLLLLHNLAGVPTVRRTARYRCSLTASRDGECIATAHGTVEGIILASPRGDGGFGYDPLFYLPELGRTMAEISLEQKATISHRGRALQKLLRTLADRRLDRGLQS